VTRPTHVPKILISAGVCVLLAIHLTAIRFDPIALGLIGLALLPWLASVLDVAEIPGGFRFQFRKVKEEQERQARELDWIKTLIGLVLSDYERMHLRSLAREGAFIADVKKGSTFEWELRHLTSLRLVGRHPNRGMRTLFSEEGKRDVKEHLFITEQGRQYLRIFDESASA